MLFQPFSLGRLRKTHPYSRRVHPFVWNDFGLFLENHVYAHYSSKNQLAISDTAELRVLPEIRVGYSVAKWQIELRGDGSLIKALWGRETSVPPTPLISKIWDFEKSAPTEK
jgi:hypothetical protein